MVGTARTAPLPTLRWSRMPGEARGHHRINLRGFRLFRKRTRECGSSRCGGDRSAASRPGMAPNRHNADSSSGGARSAGVGRARHPPAVTTVRRSSARSTVAARSQAAQPALPQALWVRLLPHGLEGQAQRQERPRRRDRRNGFSSRSSLFLSLDHFGHRRTARQAPTSRKPSHGNNSFGRRGIRWQRLRRGFSRFRWRRIDGRRRGHRSRVRLCR